MLANASGKIGRVVAQAQLEFQTHYLGFERLFRLPFDRNL